MREVTAYQCEWCNKIKSTKKAVREHESKCYKNPSLKSCYSCKHLVVDDTNGKRAWCDEFNQNISEKPWNNECATYMYYGTEMSYPFTCERFKKQEASEAIFLDDLKSNQSTLNPENMDKAMKLFGSIDLEGTVIFNKKMR